ncbi:hypothetical protein IHE44_0001446, partial [Lamprotornis superbus]
MPKVQSERLFCLRGLIWTVPSGPAPPLRPSSSTAWRWSFSAASTSWGGSAPSSPASSISPRLRSRSGSRTGAPSRRKTRARTPSCDRRHLQRP